MTILHGPPGTGKLRTLAALVHVYLATTDGKKVLVVGPSNESVWNLFEKYQPDGCGATIKSRQELLQGKGRKWSNISSQKRNLQAGTPVIINIGTLPLLVRRIGRKWQRTLAPLHSRGLSVPLKSHYRNSSLPS